MSDYDITVIVTVYNQPLSDVKKTLASIASQTGCTYELLIGDDYSKEDKTTEIEALCRELRINHFRVIRHERNLKTVGNILQCLKSATGTYVKTIGSGDTLFNESTLQNIVAFCESNDIKAGFGDVIIEQTGARFVAPRNTEDFEVGSTPDRAQLLKHALMWADWIPGGSQFFEKGYFVSLMSKLYHDYGVRYCEDFAQIAALSEGMVYHLALPVLVYDNEGGISTSGSMDSRKRMYDDHLRFYQGIKNERPIGLSLVKEYAMFSFRRFIALKTPVYPLLQRLTMRSYSKENEPNNQS